MRAFVQRLVPFAVVGLAAVLAGRATAQSNPAPGGAPDNRLESAAAEVLISNATGATEPPDEITVEGRKDQLGKYRLEMSKAKGKIVEVFNKVNSSDDTDVKCRTEKPTGSRLGHSVCRSKAEDAADAGAAKGFLGALLRSSGGSNNGTSGALAPPQGQISQVNAVVGTGRSRQEGGAGEEEARANLEAELKRLMAENKELFRAVVKYVEARDDYNEARGQGTVVYKDGAPVVK
ncbi:MAG TPA: hypothetical protein VE907_12030 [Gammaproteobacteria bacterium]|nr:hypothetical protein [Gammaproteobacteria bacterium]